MDKHKTPRSDCPISFCLDYIGDKWSLLIIRDIAYANKRTFNEFLDSGEGIARNILASRLTQLQNHGIITKEKHPTDGRKDIYQLTAKGTDLIPVLVTLSNWGNKYRTL